MSGGNGKGEHLGIICRSFRPSSYADESIKVFFVSNIPSVVVNNSRAGPVFFVMGTVTEEQVSTRRKSLGNVIDLVDKGILFIPFVRCDVSVKS